MGKINEYQRRQLASSAVGTAAPDASGQILGQAIEKLGAAVTIRAEEQKRKDKVYDDLAINNNLIKWSQGAAEIEGQLRNEYAGNPKEYPKALVDKLQESATTDAAAIQDEEVKTGFAAQSGNYIRKMGVEGVVWAAAKRQENAFIDVKGGLDTAIIAAGNGRTTLESSIQTISDTLHLTEDLDLDGMGLDPDVRRETQDAYNLAALNAHIAYRTENDSYGVLRDLSNGAYDNVMVETSSGKVRVPLDDKSKKAFITLAEKASTQQEYKRKLDQILQADGSSQAFTEGYFKGEIGISAIEQEIARVSIPGSGADPKYVDNMKALLSVAVSRQALEARIDNPAIVGPIQSDFFVLSSDVAGVTKLQKEKPGSPKAKRDAASLTSDLLAIRTRAANAHAGGHMTRATWMAMERTFSKVLSLGIASQAAGSGDPQGRGLIRYRDEFGGQYEKMNTVINDMANLSVNQKAEAKVRAASYFMDNVMTQRSLSPKQELTPAQYDGAQRAAVRSVQAIYTPEYQGLKVGDMYLGLPIVEIGDDGVPRVALTKDIQKLKDNAN